MKENSKEQPSSQSDGASTDLRHKIYKGQATIVALVLFIVGIAFIAWSATVHVENGLVSEMFHHVLRDLGLAAIISALLGSAYEYLLRSDFVDDAEEALGRAVNTERENLTDRYIRDAKTSLIDVLDARDALQRQLDEAGLIGIHSGRTIGRAQLIREQFESNPKQVRILETWTGHRGEGIDDWIHGAIEADCTSVEILLLDPDSREVESRARALGDDSDQVRGNIRSDLKMFEKIKLDHEDIVKIRVYDDSPSVNMFSFEYNPAIPENETIIFGLYLWGMDSVRFPQFRVSRRVGVKDGFLLQQLEKHFRELWNATETKVWPPLHTRGHH